MQGGGNPVSDASGTTGLERAAEGRSEADDDQPGSGWWRPVRQRRCLRRRGGWALALAAVIPIGLWTIVMTPLGHSVTRLAPRLTAEARSLFHQARPAPVLGQPKLFGGTPAVGALFTTTAAGQLGSHFCTASVVDSPGRDLLLTAAHCVKGASSGGNGKPIVFVPGFHDGRDPYGVWRVTRIVVDHNWTSSADPDDDFAFLVTSGPGGRKVQDVTGGERLGRSMSLPAGQIVQVVGYPRGGEAPIVCTNRTRGFSASQLEFDCGGYTDGTSGGPLLRDVNPSTGLGTVIGVIGGYEQGGDTAAVSYAARFGPSVAALYESAIRER
jgi:V8-like Glu-specific endopeptidase